MASWPKASEEELRRRRAAGQLLIEALQEHRLLQGELARRLGVSRQTVNSGLREGTWTLAKLARAAVAAGFRLQVDLQIKLYSAEGGWLAETTVADTVAPADEVGT